MIVCLFLDQGICHEGHAVLCMNVTNLHFIHHDDLFSKLHMTEIICHGAFFLA